MTDEEFEKEWAMIKAAEAQDIAEWNALSVEEKKRRVEGYDQGFLDVYQRIHSAVSWERTAVAATAMKRKIKSLRGISRTLHFRTIGRGT